MPPKPARCYVSIPVATGGRGGRRGRGSGRGAGSEEDDRDSMPLFHRKSSQQAQGKRKAEGTPEQARKRVAKDPILELGKGADKSASGALAKKGDDAASSPLIKGRVAEAGNSSLRPAIYKQLTLPTMIPALRAFAKLRKSGFLERSEVPVPESLKKRWSRSAVKDNTIFQPRLNVLDDESLLLDRPSEGGNLGYRLL